MSEIRKIYWIWYRDVLRFWREKSRIISSLAMPLLWLVIFGSGMRAVPVQGTENFQEFLFPGIVGMSLLFTSIMSGISVIWDREFGFFKEIMVAPVARSSVVIGKALGGSTSALLQGIILLPLSYLIGLHLSWLSILIYLPLMVLIAVGLVSIGLVIASLIDSMEAFNLIMSFVIMPIFFLSGALFPLTSAPGWLRGVSYVNPLTYGVDLLRWASFGSWETILPVHYEIFILVAFAAAMILICSYTFNVKK